MEQRFIKTKTPFIDEISGLIMVKLLDKKEQSTHYIANYFLILA